MIGGRERKRNINVIRLKIAGYGDKDSEHEILLKEKRDSIPQLNFLIGQHFLSNF